MNIEKSTLHSDLLVLHIPKSMPFSEEQFFEFCVENKELRIERSIQGDFEIMSPTGGLTSWRNSSLIAEVYAWAKQEGKGVVFDSSGGFILPNGTTRSPDVSWVKKSRLAHLTSKQKQRFLPLCPDFVIELRSPTDSLKTLKKKMQEYMENGAGLGWLINPQQQQVFIYQPKKAVVILERPKFLTDDLLLVGFKLEMRVIWDVEF